MRRWRHRLLVCAAVVLLTGRLWAQTPAPSLAELDALQTLSQRNSAEALQALRAAAPRYEATADIDLQRAYLGSVIDAAFETGQAAVVSDAIGKLHALAAGSGDASTRVLAVSAQARQWATMGRTQDAMAALAREAGAADKVADPWVRWLYHLTQGTLLGGNGEFEAGLDHVLQSLALAQQLPRQAAIAELRSRTHLELIQFSMKNPDKALQTIREAMLLAERLDARQAMGWLQLHRGNAENVLGRLDTALDAYRQAWQIGRTSGLAGLQATALNNIGDIHLQRKAYAEAEPVMRQAMKAYRDAHELSGAALSQANLGYALMGQGQIDAGVKNVQAGIRFMRDAGARPMEEQLLGELSRMYEQAGLYREAVETTRQQQALAADLFRIEREQAVGALQEQFDTVQRQRQIDRLAQDNRIKDAELQSRHTQQMALAAAAGVTVLAAAFIFVLYRRTRSANQALRIARQQAENALTEKNLFLATASHDLRQPIHAMSLMVEAIGLRNQTPALKPLLADLRSSMQAMNQLFNALLDLSRLESGQKPGAAGPVDLCALLTDMARQFREQASMGGLRLRVRLPQRSATVWAEPVLLRQALANLLQNAIRYTPRGQVLISARARGADWLIEVWDTGVGIDSADQKQVFSPYFRAEDTGANDGAGHGLGLAVVARCAEQLGATYGLQSRVGRGSRFWLRLPAHRATPTPSAPPARDRSEAHPMHSLQGRCLVLDDDPQVLNAWRAMLTGWGVDARLARTSNEAFDHLQQGFVPDAIFCDQRLRRGESGFDVLRRLLVQCPGASAAMVSGELDSPELAQAEDEGYLVLRKPLDPVQLHDLLRSWFTTGRFQSTSPST